MGNDWKLAHVGLPVRDMDKAVEYYQSLGIAKMEPEFQFDTNTFGHFEAFGKSESAQTRVRMVQIGSLPLEFIHPNPMPEESQHKETSGEPAEVISHIAFWVDDLEKEVAKLEEKGFTVVVRASQSDGS